MQISVTVKYALYTDTIDKIYSKMVQNTILIRYMLRKLVVTWIRL